ncbi:papilin [Crotalus adamanteus]|uniref:Papilin n=1 Tax=Crotalus adamanteus TaxID=8729 RepID=A0AAW1C7K4_CROAD
MQTPNLDLDHIAKLVIKQKLKARQSVRATDGAPLREKFWTWSHPPEAASVSTLPSLTSRSRHQDTMVFLILLVTLAVMSPSTLAARKAKRQNDFWGIWGEWGECSRSCGGGISLRHRHCYSRRTDGGSSCIGPAQSYRSCNIQDCPEGSKDFRAEQCAEFDGTEFQGKKYKWLPYYGAPNKCELNCIPKGENFYYRQKDTVIDGTPCEPGTNDICVQGTCHAVGCDKMLDSSQKEDKCLQCGGNGRACFEVKGLFDVPNLPKGYNQIFVIPMGATSIRIKEANPTRNFLAIKNVQGTYYLNGQWTIEYSQALPIASTVMHYERGSEGDLAPELLHARGPITEPLIIELISQEPNQGVHYEYYLPFQRQTSSYNWGYGSWSDCSAECGGGYQSRLVFCTIDNEAYPDYMCRDKPWPGNNRTCGLQACPHTKRISYLYLPGAWSRNRAWNLQTKSWKTGDWSQCSATCGGGIQSRSVYCATYNGHNFQDAMDDTECASLTEKPHSTQPCNLQRCATWVTSLWSECSVSCGEGIQTRTVSCQSEQGPQILDVACSRERKPPHTQPCIGENCIQEIGWHIGDWGLCSKSCGSGIRTRQVICADGDSKFYSHEICQEIQPQIPTMLGSCNTQPCHLPQQVPSMQDITGFNTSRRTLLTRYHPDQGTEVSRHERIIQTGSTHRQVQPNESPRSNFLPLGGDSYSDSSVSRRSHSYPNGDGNDQDCNHTPHGCCSDGRTAAAGPFGQGCPLDSCHLSRYGCCPDGVSHSHGPNQEGCTQYYSDVYISRNLVTPTPTASQVLAQQVPTEECRGSMYGCCYDNIASALGPQGEGCPTRLSQSYPVQCLLPSAHGSCTDWTIRWYFSEKQLTVNGQTTQHEEWRRESGTDGLTQRRFGYQIPQGSTFQYSLNRIFLDGSESSAVEAGLGQSIRLLCKTDNSHLSRVEWQKDGQPISSDRHTYQSDSSLVISHLRTEDAGIYTCILSNGRVERRQIELLIKEIPQSTLTQGRRHQLTHDQNPQHRIFGARTNDGRSHVSSLHPQITYRLKMYKNEPSIVDASIGEQVRLPCRVDASPSLTIEWQKDGRPISSARHRQQPDGALLISHLTSEDAGFFTCIASNGRDQDQKKVQIRPRGDLRIIDLLPRLSVSEGENAHLHCVVTGNNVNIRWSRNGVPVRSDGHRIHVSQDGSLFLNNVQLGDEGSYTCNAYSSNNSVSASTDVKVIKRRSEVPASLPVDTSRECVDQPHLANCDLILQAQLCNNEYYSSFCCASCSRRYG